MEDRHHPATRPRSREVLAQARRRRLKRVMAAVLLGLVVWSFTLGALGARVNPGYQNDILPPPVEAILLGVAFVIGALPVSWSIIGRVIIPVPTFFLYLAIFLGKNPP